jgi:hypothetical protein
VQLFTSESFESSLKLTDIMSKSMAAFTISDDISTDVAQAILTKQKEWGRDPKALLNVVRIVHDTLRDLSLRSTTDSPTNESHSAASSS